MNEGLVRFARYVRDLLQQPEGDSNGGVVYLGRDQFRSEDFEALQIVVDGLAQDRLISTSEKYDHVNEIMHKSQVWDKALTIDFYGDGAYQEALKYTALLNSRLSTDLQQTLNIAVYQISTITDLKRLTGEQYIERQQIEVKIRYTTSIDYSELRIDNIPIQLKTEQDTKEWLISTQT